MPKARNRFFYVIVMPLDENGHGPAEIGKGAVKLTWEVWDQELSTHGSFDYLPDAIDHCEELNAIG